MQRTRLGALAHSRRYQLRMISSISTASMFQRTTQSSILTEEQSTKLTKALTEYDTENLSDDDAKALVSTIKELGIAPSAGLAKALSEAGIDARELAEQAGISGGGPGGPGGGPGGPGRPDGQSGSSSGVDEAVLSLIQEATESYEASEIEESFADILAATLTENGYDSSQPTVDFYA
ncbi:hypothetical protein [Roseobacter sp.]|uniref:hypothetical protein n=1 Tax=Roseobacter sp. TaxID=1907202 RepID=UPI0032969006